MTKKTKMTKEAHIREKEACERGDISCERCRIFDCGYNPEFGEDEAE